MRAPPTAPPLPVNAENGIHGPARTRHTQIYMNNSLTTRPWATQNTSKATARLVMNPSPTLISHTPECIDPNVLHRTPQPYRHHHPPTSAKEHPPDPPRGCMELQGCWCAA